MRQDPPPLLICAGFDWHHPSPLRHLEIQLADGYEVVHIESIGMRRPALAATDARRLAWKGWRWLTRRTGSEAEATVVSPLALPFPGSDRVRALNARALQRQLVARVGERARTPDLFLTALPTAVDLLQRLQPRLSAYYRVDDWPCWPGIDGDLVRRLEGRLMERVDVTVCTSSALLDGARDRHGAATLLPQGVDTEHFGRALEDGPCHRSVDGLRPPVAGFFGLLDDRLDQRLLARFCRSWPGSVVLAGQQRVPVELPGDHVHLPGHIPYEELPALARGVHVWLLPYVVGPRTDAIDPLKLREYLATGRSVVSTDLPAVRPWVPHVAVAEDAGPFTVAAAAAAADPGAGRSGRLAALEGHTWADRRAAFLDRLAGVPVSDPGRGN